MTALRRLAAWRAPVAVFVTTSVRRLSSWRALVVVLAATTVAAGLLGTYSYGEAYWQHRGFAPVALRVHARIGRLLTVHFYSGALHRRSDYLVYLPPGYSRAHRYPSYYLLHGAPGGPQDFISVVNLNVRLSNRLSEHQLRPMILVMPDGRPNGNTFRDSEWANTRRGAYENYVIDVVRDVSQRFSAIPSRQARVIAGYSAGAYGALNVALHHLSVFANVQSWSGYYVQTRATSGIFRHASQAVLTFNSPLYYARTLRRAITRYPLRVYMFTGRRDPDGREIGRMARVLRRSGAIATYNLYPGGHDWQVWYARVNAMMLLASEMVSHPVPVPSPALGGPAAPKHNAMASARRERVIARTRAGLPDASAHAVRYGAVSSRSRPGARGLDTTAWLGLVLALVSAALINLGFLLQQRGLVRVSGDGVRAWWSALRNRIWLAGQAVGWLGFGAQIIAVALAPLSLVQAFAAGGLALSVPLAAGIFRHRVPRLQVIAVAAVAASLAVLPIGVARADAGMATAAMIWVAAIALAAGAIIVSNRHAAAQAIAAGLFYGVADAAIKAVALAARAHGPHGLVSGWTVLIVLGTFAGFLVFQAALRHGNPVSAISLMTAVTTLTAVLFGVTAFAEPLGSGSVMTLVHLLAITVVLACVPLLAHADHNVRADQRRIAAIWKAVLVRGLRGAGATAAVGVSLFVAILTGTGLLYGLRGLGWFAAGPRMGDALPLLQLAGFDAQPLVRVAVAWLLAGAVLGLALIRVRPAPRALMAGSLGLLLLLFASEACFALARNLRLSHVLASRLPGAGAWIEALLFAAAATLPRPLRRRLALGRDGSGPLMLARQLLSGRVT